MISKLIHEVTFSDSVVKKIPVGIFFSNTCKIYFFQIFLTLEIKYNFLQKLPHKLFSFLKIEFAEDADFLEFWKRTLNIITVLNTCVTIFLCLIVFRSLLLETPFISTSSPLQFIEITKGCYSSLNNTVFPKWNFETLAYICHKSISRNLSHFNSNLLQKFWLTMRLFDQILNIWRPLHFSLIYFCVKIRLSKGNLVQKYS